VYQPNECSILGGLVVRKLPWVLEVLQDLLEPRQDSEIRAEMDREENVYMV
jgi:hypothetical protein